MTSCQAARARCQSVGRRSDHVTSNRWVKQTGNERRCHVTSIGTRRHYVYADSDVTAAVAVAPRLCDGQRATCTRQVGDFFHPTTVFVDIRMFDVKYKLNAIVADAFHTHLYLPKSVGHNIYV